MAGWLGTYFRAGPTIPLGSDPFPSNRDAGVNIQAGVRQRITCGRFDYIFYDLGGSFMSIRGQRSSSSPGFLQNITAATSTPVEDLLNVNLLDVRRAGVDIGLGAYFHPLRVVGVQSRFLRASVRGGGRFGTAFGRFRNDPTANALAAIALLPPGAQYALRGAYSHNSSFAGLFVALGADLILSQREVKRGKRPYFSIGAEVEYSHDWVNFKNFSNNPLDVITILTSGNVFF
jgi:hypothetical protein